MKCYLVFYFALLWKISAFGEVFILIHCSVEDFKKTSPKALNLHRRTKYNTR